MDAKKKKRIIIWVSVATLLGVGSYVAWKYFKSKAKPQTPDAPQQSTTPSSETATGQNSSPVAPFNTGAYQAAWQQAKKENRLTFYFEGKVYSAANGKVVPNPFKNKEQIIAFQTFVKNVMKDNSIGVIDGLWGPRTAAAMIKYANQYYANK